MFLWNPIALVIQPVKAGHLLLQLKYNQLINITSGLIGYLKYRNVSCNEEISRLFPDSKGYEWYRANLGVHFQARSLE